MPFLYVTQPGAVVRKTGERFLVEADQHIRLDCPSHKLESIVLFGNVQITTQALAEALDHAIPVSFLSRNGRFRGKVNGDWTRNVSFRLAQYRLYEDGGRCMELARRCIVRKITNGQAVLERYLERDAALAEALHAAQSTMAEQRNAAGQAGTRAELDGHEGAAAAAYFGALMHFNRSPFEWSGRVKHPAPDPLNALLSFGYTLLMQELLALIETEGLDPGLGFLHQMEERRPSLALDLMEPSRHALVDRMVLTMVNRHQFVPDDFGSDGELSGLHLEPDALRRFLGEYERWMLSPVNGETGRPWRQVLHREVRVFMDSIGAEGLWEPFTFPWVDVQTQQAAKA
jgi:CRISPR-associated protein Cas1